MSVDKEAISKTVLELDKEFNKRWSNGDSRGYLDAYTDDATYFEPAVKKMIVGKDKIIAWIDSIYVNEHIVRNEYLNPQVHVNGSGDFALMAYNLNTYVLDEKGKERLQAIAARRLKGPVAKVHYGLEQVRDAQADVESGTTPGKHVVVPDDSDLGHLRNDNQSPTMRDGR
jgi:ketosteroid isomerase-like protein